MGGDRLTHKKGLFIVNEFLNTNKFSEHSDWLMKAAKRKKIELDLLTNAEILADLSSEKREWNAEQLRKEYEFALFWDKDIRLAKYLETNSLRVYNSSESIALCDDKSMTHLKLMSHNIPMPRTILAPMTYPNIGYTNYDFLKRVIEQIKFPMVVKECFGSFGAQVYLSHNREELLDIVTKIGSKPFLFQEFISSSTGRDVRLQVVGGQVIASMYRYSENGDFRANISNGGKMKSYVPNENEIRLAEKCCNILKLDFAGVDILWNEDGFPIVCEVNSNAHFRNIYECTGINTADAILEHIAKTEEIF